LAATQTPPQARHEFTIAFSATSASPAPRTAPHVGQFKGGFIGRGLRLAREC
jgi:hypothetical protein